MLNSLRSRLMLSYFFVGVICLSVTTILLLILVQPLQNRMTYLRLLDRSVPTVLWVRELLQRNVTPADITQRFSEQTDQQRIQMLLVDREGLILADSREQLAGRRTEEFALQGEANLQWPLRGQWKSPEGQRLYYVALPAVPLRAVRRNLPPDAVIVVLATDERYRLFIEFVPFLFLSVILGLLVSILFALWIARSISRPLQQVTLAAEEISRGNYDQALEISSPNEVSRLAASFNRMTQQVKASQQSQRDFVANVSHELKTPLTSIRGFAQAILDGTARDVAGQHQAAQIIKGEAERMARLVEELLTLAKISADKGWATWVEVDVSALLQACAQRLAVVAQKKGVDFQVAAPPVPHVRGDPDRLAQVFTNLLDNALKHSPNGSHIVASVQTSSQPAARRGQVPKTWIEVSIADSGEGIPPEDLSRIFERFYQIDKSRSGQEGGAGLGLAIAKEIVEAHDGNIRAESKPGAGARFIVTLPAA